ncbi:S-methyl-5-thioribose-1-phosphate isomerase [soil metagenome]
MIDVPPPPVQPLRLVEGRVEIIDQTLLPDEERWIPIDSAEDMREAIRSLRIRGAPAISIAAAFGMAIAANRSTATSTDDLLRDLNDAGTLLEQARPTAVNLGWAVRRVLNAVGNCDSKDLNTVRSRVWTEAQQIMAEDVEMCRRIGLAGAELLSGGSVLTHCNTGGLATAGYGTALSVIFMAHALGQDIHVYVDETRPLLQGARLNTWELSKAGIQSTLITDNMAAAVLSRGEVRAAIVGADRVAANGDVANKIGTLGVAIIARHYGVPFYVAIPTSTIDFDCQDGDHIPIEERPAVEVLEFRGVRTAAPGTEVYNPAFDVTPADLVSAFITEHGVIEPPYGEHLSSLRG